MPLYSYKCKCGEEFTQFLKLAELEKEIHCHICHEVATRVISAPMVIGDYQPYDCPITGKRIEGRKAHEENLKRHGCRVYEVGETEAFRRKKAEEDSRLERSIAESVEKSIESMPSDKVAKLAKEVESGVNINYSRGE